MKLAVRSHRHPQFAFYLGIAMQVLRNHRRWSLVPALIWLAAQMTMAQVSAAPVKVSPASPGGPLFEVVICTPTGLKTIVIDPQGSDGGETAPSSAGMGCKWCQAFGAGAVLAPPAEVSLANPLGLLIIFSRDHGQMAVVRPVTASFHSRAPPLFETAI